MMIGPLAVSLLGKTEGVQGGSVLQFKTQPDRPPGKFRDIGLAAAPGYHTIHRICCMDAVAIIQCVALKRIAGHILDLHPSYTES